MRFSGFQELLEHYAAVSPDAPALIYEDREKKVCSFSALKKLVAEKADAFRSSGKRCIGILSDGSFDCVVTILAANIAGLQVVMLDAFSPSSTLKGSIPYADIDCLWGDEELCEELSPFLTVGPGGNYADRVLFFTSGTTSSSKAVVLTGQSLMSSAWNGSQKLPLDPSDILLCMLPLGHVFGFVCGLLWGLSCGAAVALGRGTRHYMDDCRYYQPTALSAVPSLLGFLLAHEGLNESLRLILIGAGDCPADLLSAVQARNIRVSFGYGLTETSSGVAISTKGDPFAMEVCPDDEIILAPDGEILIKAPTCMMQGYYKMPEATAEAIRGGLLYSGDLGRFDDDGFLHITGRKKDVLVMPSGTKIFLPEYESRLAAALGTTELAVVLKDGRPMLVLCGEAEEEEAVRKKIRPVMDEYPRGQQIAGIVFRSTPLPRTATGKIQRYKINVN